MKTKTFIFLLPLISALLSCERYLDVKPDQSLTTPTTLQGLQALLDNETDFAQNYPRAGDIAADYFSLTYSDWASVSFAYDRDTYIWLDDAARNADWSGSYELILITNVILDEIGKIPSDPASENSWNNVAGSAYFFRGWRYFLLSQLFAPHYLPGVNDNDYGLPLRTSPDINIPSVRATLQETYDLIIADLVQAAHLLPVNSSTPTRPAKPAAFAALARVHLVLGDWDAAYRYADSCLQLYPHLLDFNQIPTESPAPFELFNMEVLLHTLLSGADTFNPARAKVDSTLYDSYSDSDLRKAILFRSNADGTHAFKGNYSGSPTNAALFSGLATDEVYLMKAEALARLDRGDEALEVLNTLLANRHDHSWQPYTLEDVGDDLLGLILIERKKSLAFRGGIRWSDLRRLNMEDRFAETLIRDLVGQMYNLPPNDLRYTFLIPSDVIQLTGMPQNPR